jgi:putative ABC transport system permease protein
MARRRRGAFARTRSHLAVTLTGLAVRNLARNKFRVGLTVLAVAIAIVAFLLLRTVTWAWIAGPESAPKDRVVTRHKLSMAMALPKRYVSEVRGAPHIRAATWANLFAGKDPRHETEMFASLAIDPATYFAVYDEIQISPQQLQAFQQDKQGAVVGDLLARRLGWKVGDRVILKSGFLPGEWEFTIESLYTATAKTVDRASFLFHWDYVNDAIPAERRDMVGWIVSRVDDPRRVAQIGVELDAIFDERETQTLSQDERSFNASFLAMFSAILKAMNVISAVILLIMMLILGNTIAMGVRERTGEYGVLRAIGFLPGHIALWIVAESLAMGTLGGLLGTMIAWPFINVFVQRLIDEYMASFFPYFGLRLGPMLLGLAIATLLGGVAAAIPAWNASRLRVVDAVRRVV